MKKKLLIAVVAALGLAGSLGLVARHKGAAVERPAAAMGAVERRSLQITVEASGLVEPIRVVEVKSRAAGEVREVKVETGDFVEQGVLLAEIDPRDVQNALVQAQADLQAARVKRSTTEANRKRLEELRASGVVTVQEYESTVDSAASAYAAQVRAETNLELAKERRGDVTLRAPISGTVIERTAEPGTIIASATGNVSGGTTLFKMADLTSMQVRVRVDETDIGQVTAGLPVRVTVQAYPDRKFMGKVLKIEPQAVIEQNVTMFPVLVRLENPEGLLKPGMNGEVAIEIASRVDAIVVPNASVVTPKDAQAAAATVGVSAEALKAALNPGAADAGTRARGGRGQRADRAGGTRPGVVFVESSAGAVARKVTLGLSDWEHTEVLAGLEPGERVVLISIAQLQQKQQEATERMKQRTGGGMLGGGAAATGRGRGG